MARRRKKREPKEVEFDLTPMIDVTFQLLIFFIVAMKFKQTERRQGANLSLESGPNPTPAEKTKKITIRVEWDPSNKSMKYAVCRGDNKTPEVSEIDGGTLAKLIEDRFNEGYPHYRTVWTTLVAHLQKTYQNEPEATKIEIALTNKTSTSVSLQSLENQPPWGFITLALDACTEFNKQLIKNPPATLPEKYRERGIEVVTKNASPEALYDRAK